MDLRSNEGGIPLLPLFQNHQVPPLKNKISPENWWLLRWNVLFKLKKGPFSEMWSIFLGGNFFHEFLLLLTASIKSLQRETIICAFWKLFSLLSSERIFEKTGLEKKRPMDVEVWSWSMIFHQPGLPKICHYSDTDRTVTFKQKMDGTQTKRLIRLQQFILENNPIVAPNCFKRLGAEQGCFSMRVLLIYKHIMLDIQLNDWMPLSRRSPEDQPN